MDSVVSGPEVSCAGEEDNQHTASFNLMSDFVYLEDNGSTSDGSLLQHGGKRPNEEMRANEDADYEEDEDEILAKQKKLDKDGFVTPATPDIPKTSVHYDSSTEQHHLSTSQHYDTSDNSIAVTGGTYYTSSGHIDDTSTPYVSAGNVRYVDQHTGVEDIHSGMSDNVTDGPAIESTSEFMSEMQQQTSSAIPQASADESNCSAPAFRVTSSEGSIAGMENGATESVHVDELLKDLGQNVNTMYADWALVFREREDFETLCPERFDRILTEALALESNLKQQKELLRNRLLALSNTLQMI